MSSVSYYKYEHLKQAVPYFLEEVEGYIRGHDAALLQKARENEYGIAVASKKDTHLPVTLRYRIKGRDSKVTTELHIPSQVISTTHKKCIKKLFILTEHEIKIVAQAGLLKSKATDAHYERLLREAEISQLLVQHGARNIMPMELITYRGRNGTIKHKIIMTLGKKNLSEFLCTFWYKNEIPQQNEKKTLLRIAREIAIGLRETHDCGYCHRDMKPENILFDAVGRLLLIDFEFTAKEGSVNGLGGTVGFLSPEMIASNPRSIAALRSVDIWALGVCFLELLLHFNPFQKFQTDLFDHGMRGKETGELLPQYHIRLNALIDTVCSFLISTDEPILQLTAALLHPDPTKRPSACTIVSRLEMMESFGEDFVMYRIYLKNKLTALGLDQCSPQVAKS